MRFLTRAAIEGEEHKARMRENLKRDLPRLKPRPERPETDILAIVGYGPSLNQSWQEIEDFPYVCSTSAAHDFIIERGIIPDFHVEFDPREHKTAFLTKPTATTEYLIGSLCHPKLFEQLKDAKVLLWTPLGKSFEDARIVREAEEDGILLLGGSNVGLRALCLGHLLGFRSFALFGIDCGYADENTIWAGSHTGPKHSALPVECNGRKFWSSAAMLNAADELWDTMFVTMRGCKFRVFGDHLFQERLKLATTVDWKLATESGWWKPIGWELQEAWPAQVRACISKDYAALNRVMHQITPDYGNRGGRHGDLVRGLMAKHGTIDVLDYGCGKRGLERELGIKISNYDPAISGCERRPKPADIVVCTDVLEHIEPQSFEAVLGDLVRVTKREALLAISTIIARKHYPDGRNTHMIVRNASWWRDRLRNKFNLTDVREDQLELVVTATPK